MDDAPEIDGQQPVQIGEVRLQYLASVDDPRHVPHHVDRAHLVRDGRRPALHFGRVGDVNDLTRDDSSLAPDLTHDVRQPGLVDVAEREADTGATHGEGEGAANTRRGTGDGRYPAWRDRVGMPSQRVPFESPSTDQ